ncbi:hypothetical protein BDV93DRAFT_506832 [Ceratobasidium sp. AG-I]|nr:hypothetical protein BDV93DRAFT_506832 [Ceratobasidium sp. AG-I]
MLWRLVERTEKPEALHLRVSWGIQRSRVRAGARAQAGPPGAQFPGAGSGIPGILPRNILIQSAPMSAKYAGALVLRSATEGGVVPPAVWSASGRFRALEHHAPEYS